VSTNVGYSVVATFFVQQETTAHIEEALRVLKKWNATWIPNSFITDCDQREITALENVFESKHIVNFIVTTLYLNNKLFFKLFAALIKGN